MRADPDAAPELNYELALADVSDAEALAASGDNAGAIEKLASAARAFGDAAGTPSLAARAHHAAARAYYRALQLSKRAGAPETELKPLATRAITAFGRARSADEEASHTAAAVRRGVQARLALPVLFLAQGDSDRALKAANEYLRTSESGDRNNTSIMMVRLKAAARLLRSSANSHESYLFQELEAAASAIIGSGADPQLLSAVCSMVASTFTTSAERIKNVDGERAATLQRRGLSWLERRASVDEESASDLASALATARELKRGGMESSAMALLTKALAVNAPDGNCIQVEFDEALVQRAARSVVLDDEKETDRLRERIRTLGPLVQTTGEQRDWDEAMLMISGILKDYPDITVRKMLGDMQSELNRRLMCLEAHVTFAECARNVAGTLMEKTPEDGRRLYAEAIESCRTARSYYGGVNALRIDQAACHEALGQDDEAIALYAEASKHATSFSETDYVARTRMSRLLFKQKRFRDAAAFPNLLIYTVPEPEWRPHFPDAREFVAKCEEHTGPPPARAITEDAPYDQTPSAADSVLMGVLKGIDRKVQFGFERAEDLPGLRRAAIEHHLSRLLTLAIESPRSQLRAGRITKKRAQELQREHLTRLLTQPPFRLKALRELAASLKILETPTSTTPTRLIPEEVRRAAEKLGLLGSR
jgi:tetratricopeptide (TPR) repeat protein